MSTSNTCQEYVELLDAYLDDELDLAERNEVEAHLAGCSACARKLKETSRLLHGLKALPKVESKREIDFSFLETKALPSCDPIIELLDAYHDGELDSAERNSVDKHLLDCQPCTVRLGVIGDLVLGLKSLPKMLPSRDLIDAIDFESIASRPATQSCGDMLELLDAYHDSELNKDETELLESHLAGCESCLHELDRIRTIVAELKALPKVEPVRDLLSNLALETESASASSSASNILAFPSKKAYKPFGRGLQLGLCSVAAAAVAFVFAINFKQVPSTDEIALNPPTPALTQKAPVARAEKTSAPENNNLPENETANNPSQENERQIASLPPSSQPQIEREAVQEKYHEVINAETQRGPEATSELAAMPETGNGAGAEALGIATDEDGMYDLKI